MTLDDIMADQEVNGPIQLLEAGTQYGIESIAISRLMFKLIDWIILLLFEDIHALDDLQYSGCSGNN